MGNFSDELQINVFTERFLIMDSENRTLKRTKSASDFKYTEKEVFYGFLKWQVIFTLLTTRAKSSNN